MGAPIGDDSNIRPLRGRRSLRLSKAPLEPSPSRLTAPGAGASVSGAPLFQPSQSWGLFVVGGFASGRLDRPTPSGSAFPPPIGQRTALSSQSPLAPGGGASV